MESSNSSLPKIEPKQTVSSNQSIRQERMPQYQTYIKWMWRLYLGGLSFSILLFGFLSFQLPSFSQLENPRSRVASEIYSSDGVLLGKYFIENRTPVPFDSISEHVVNALIATEDARFYKHSGIDPEALGRVLVKTVVLRNPNAGGGSTISQQLAKLLVGRPNTSKMFFLQRYWVIFTTKLKEWLTAVKLERSYTKKEILAMYLNEFDFLYGANGIKSAADTYFNKDPKDLNINESAMLVRMLKNPSEYNYKRHMETAMRGREVVLKNMLNKKHITKEQYNTLRVEKIDETKFRVLDHNEGSATYFREYLREYLKEILARKENLKANGEPYDIYRDGIKIYTTINSKMQQHAEQAVWNHLSSHQEKLFAHWKDWNTNELEIGTKSQNPWTYKTFQNNDEEMELRVLALNRLMWESERYSAARPEYLKTAIRHELRDVDIHRILRVEQANTKPEKVNGKLIDGEAILQDWQKTGYASSDQVSQYRRLLKSPDWETIKTEYKAIEKYMKTPVTMKVFAYTKKAEKWIGGEKDTLMSPFDSIRYHRMHLQTGSIAVEPQTGYVRAWVGGINHKYFQLDHVSMGSVYTQPSKKDPKKKYSKPGRQVGSSIKPFLYALNIDLRGYSPCYKVQDIEITIEKGYGRFGLMKDWTPKNANASYSGSTITLTEALRMSLNSISAQLMKDLNSTEPFRNFLMEIGIDTAKVPSSPTICLGTPDLTPFEMTGGYTIFANGGMYSEPIFIDRIEDKNGNPIYSAGSDQVVEQVLTDNGAFVMSQMLQAVQRGAPGFHGIKSPHGGKTGTTNFQSDGWYMGITPSLVIGTWVGCDDRFIRFRNLMYGQGGSMARPIFQEFLRLLEADPTCGYDVAARFPQPETFEREMDCLKYEQFGKADEMSDDFSDPNIYIEDFDKKPKKKKPDSSSGTQ